MTQTVLLLLLALLASQIVSALILRGETRSIFRGVESRIVAERIGPVVTLLRSTPAELRDKVARTMASRRMQVWLSGDAAAPAERMRESGDDDKRARDLIARITAEIGDPDTHRVRAMVHDADDGDNHHHAAMMRRMPMGAHRADAVVSVNIDADHWLNLGIRLRPQRRLINPDTWISMGITAIVLSIIVALAMGGIARPLQRLSDAAARLGRGEKTTPLREEGPSDIRDTIRAFNDMQARLERFVGDRTRMLAAISHDLRTPITSMRLRAEMIEDIETREKMIATLEEMKAITEATLGFAKDDADGEDSRNVDLTALVGSIADDLLATGVDAHLETDARVVALCRPAALGRALRNLIENAAIYGRRANINIGDDGGAIRIVIEDNGPGIAEADMERVFEPFVRLEGSRHRATGGIGLGMAISRNIVRRHGGDVSLANRPEGGLRVTVTLPKS